MKQFKAGFSRVTITPPIGVPIAGYFFERIGDGVLDDLELNTVALSDGEKTAVVICADLCEIRQSRADEYRAAVAKAAGISADAVFIHCLHTHTGPVTGQAGEYFSDWEKSLGGYICTAAVQAIADLAPAKAGVAEGTVERVCFIRRYRMKNGYVRTNPGVNNPDIQESIGMPDESERVVRLTREGKPDIILVNFQNHPDVIGGNKYSADWPRFARETVEAGLEHTVHCVFMNGTQGDLNHVNVFPRPGESNGLEPDTFDGVLRGYEYAKNIGRAVGGEALKVCGKTAEVSALPLKYAQKVIEVPSQQPKPEEIPKAEHIVELHNAGKDAELPYKDMELTTAVAEALRMVRLKDGPDHFKLNLSAVSFGDIGFVGIPGEPFSMIGREIRKQSPFKTTFACCLTNGGEAYFPMQEAFDEGGYEARSSDFKAGIAERLIDESVDLLKKM